MTRRRIVWIVALLSLALAYAYGIQREQAETEQLVGAAFPGLAEMVRLDEQTFSYLDEAGGKRFLVVKREQGWGGPMDLAIQVDADGQLERLTILRHCETPSFLNRLFRDKFFAQFLEKSIASLFRPAVDIDTVSGATVSSKAIARAVQNGAHGIGRNYFGMKIVDLPPQAAYGFQEIAASCLLLVVFFAAWLKMVKIRRVCLAAGLVVLGFIAAFPLSITHISSLFLGRLPPFDSHLMTWILVGGAALLILVFGKNLYCSWICPFGALQELLAAISGLQLRVHPAVQRWARLIPGLLTWAALMVVFIYRNPARGNYEPFGAMFGFEGHGLVWLLLPQVIIVSFFIPRFWCRFFCPAGYLLARGVSVRNKVADRRVCHER